MSNVLKAAPAKPLVGCPHCGARPTIKVLRESDVEYHDVEISCSRDRCRMVSASSYDEAARIWNDDPEYA